MEMRNGSSWEPPAAHLSVIRLRNQLDVEFCSKSNMKSNLVMPHFTERGISLSETFRSGSGLGDLDNDGDIDAFCRAWRTGARQWYGNAQRSLAQREILTIAMWIQ